eukprot:793110_1
MISIIYCLCLVSLINVHADESSDDSTELSNCGIDTNGVTVVALQGTSDVTVSTTPNIEDPKNGEPVSALCFTFDIIRVETKEIIGTAIDCGHVDQQEHIFTEQEGGNILFLTYTTQFNLDCGNHNSITSRVHGILRPEFTHSHDEHDHDPPPYEKSVDYTHTITAMPSTDTNDIFTGSGIYKSCSGSVTLLGIQDDTNFKIINFGQTFSGSVGYNEVFILDLNCNDEFNSAMFMEEITDYNDNNKTIVVSFDENFTIAIMVLCVCLLGCIGIG